MRDGVFIGLDVSMRATGLVMLDSSGVVVDKRQIGWPSTRFPARTLRERIAYFAKVAKPVFYVAAPGAATPFLHTLDYRKIQRPIWPLDAVGKSA